MPIWVLKTIKTSLCHCMEFSKFYLYRPKRFDNLIVNDAFTLKFEVCDSEKFTVYPSMNN